MTHELKILPCYYQAVLSGNKTFEVRENADRGFQACDIVLLQEYDDNQGVYTGREMGFSIGYVLPIDYNRVVFSLIKPAYEKVEE